MSTGLGLRVKKRRLELGLSQEDLANRMELKSKSTICKVERGDDNLTTDTIRKYADALETTPAYLMGWSETPIANEIPHLQDWRVEESKRLYDLYLQAPPEIQAAVETLLKSQLRDS